MPVPQTTQPSYTIGIVGGGIAGLYSALLLQRAGHRVRVFEGTNRIGGRIRTHRFTYERNQYYEAGAMRIPQSSFHAITFALVRYLKQSALTPDRQVNLIPYNISAPGNRLHINDVRDDGYQAAATTPASLGWQVPAGFQNISAGQLMWQAIGGFIADLEADFDAGFASLLKYDSYSFRFYLSTIASWPDSVIDFVESVLSQTNQFSLGSCTEMVMQFMDFNTKDWWTIDDGMDRLPSAMAHLVGYEHITFGARVTSLSTEPDGSVTISALGLSGTVHATFDKVIMAVPPSALKMIADRPHWGHSKEQAIRSMHYEPLYKMGLRFKTRFWERVQGRSTRGGQTTTDMPIRWIVYPSNGLDTEGPGVLLIYSWMTDAAAWLPLTPTERRSLALQCIAKEYQGERDADGSIIDVYDLLIETNDYAWSADNATGDAMFLPGQFKRDFEVARRNEDNIYFAGEHLSRHHTWISGALESALWTVSQIQGRPADPLAADDEQGVTAIANAQSMPMDVLHSDVPARLHGALHMPQFFADDDDVRVSSILGHRMRKRGKKSQNISRSKERSLSLKRIAVDDNEDYL